MPKLASCVCPAIIVLAIIWAQAASAVANAEQLAKAVNDSKILGSDTEIRAELVGGDKEALIFATRNPQATDRDCKIDAVLIAKKVMDVGPASLTKVKVTFYDQTNKNNFRQVSVTKGDVKAYAARVIDEETLLDELEYKAVQSSRAQNKTGEASGTAPKADVATGPATEARATLLSRIQALKEKGVGVAPFMAQFNQIEENAKQGQEKAVAGALETLNAAVDGQFEQLKKIQEQKRLQESERFAKLAGKKRQLEENNARASAEAKDKMREKQEEWDRQERMEFARAHLGNLAPSEGPSFKRRMRIAFVLKRKIDTGVDVSNLLPVWNNLQRSAPSAEPDQLSPQVKWLETALGISTDSPEHWHHHH